MHKIVPLERRVYRPRLSYRELAIIHSLLTRDLRDFRANMLCNKKLGKTAFGRHEMEYYRTARRLLRKLDRLIGLKSRVYPSWRLRESKVPLTLKVKDSTPTLKRSCKHRNQYTGQCRKLGKLCDALVEYDSCPHFVQAVEGES